MERRTCCALLDLEFCYDVMLCNLGTTDQLKGSVGGGRGGRGGRGRKRGGKKGMRDTQAIWIGQGKATRKGVFINVFYC